MQEFTTVGKRSLYRNPASILSSVPSPPRAGIIVVVIPPNAQTHEILFVVQGDSASLYDTPTGCGNFGFPKGHKSKSDKSMIHCALRECYEETGLKFSEDDLLKHPHTQRPVSISFMSNRMYIVRLDVKPSVSIDGVEIVNYEWLSINDALQKQMSSFTMKILSIFMRQIINHRWLPITIGEPHICAVDALIKSAKKAKS